MVKLYQKGPTIMKNIPLHSLVMMVGPSGAGKSTLGKNKFDDYEIISSDAIRYEFNGDISRTYDNARAVFKEMEHRALLKLSMGERVVLDATFLKKRDRQAFTDLGRTMNVPIFYIVVNRPMEEKKKITDWRANSNILDRMEEVFISNEKDILRGDHVATVIDYRKEDFDVIKKPPYGDISDFIRHSSFNGIMVIADVHGMRESLKSAIDMANARNMYMIFLGDIIDYGPDSIDCVDIVYDLMTRGKATAILGNHERKIYRWIDQSKRGAVTVKLSDGNKMTTDYVEKMSFKERKKFENRFSCVVELSRNHVIIGDTILTHGAAHIDMFKFETSRLNGFLESLAVYGETDKEDKQGSYPTRLYNWVDELKGKSAIVGHDIRSDISPFIVNHDDGSCVVFLDTGSGKGGHLTTAHMFEEKGKFVIKAYSNH